MDAPSKTMTEVSTTVVPVVMAGGSGTRLWPLSRGQYPKQFLALLGPRTLLQDAVLRAARIERAAAPLVIGNQAHRFLLAAQVRDAGIKGATLVLEPEGRNTAAAAAVAAHFVAAEHGPEALVFLMSADHVFTDEARFQDAVRTGIRVAAAGRIVVFGIKPTYPATGFGYIKAGAPLENGSAVCEVAAFIEKPPLAKAKAFVADGSYYWNGGLFMFRAGSLMNELRRLEPQLLDAAAEACKKAARGDGFAHLDAAAFRACRKDSIDYAVMEKTDNLAVVPLDAGWDDVGSWAFLDKLPVTDAQGNRARGDVLFEDASDNLVHAGSRLVALAGVKGQVVIETDDAVLVTTREHAQAVKQVVQRLKKEKRTEAETHPRVYRPWGYYQTVASGERFQVKRIRVEPGQKLSLQKHHHRAEHWVVVQGTAQVTRGEDVFLLSENQSTYIPLGTVHRLENPGKVPLELIEVQSGAYLGEDDIVRLEDVYGRAK